MKKHILKISALIMILAMIGLGLPYPYAQAAALTNTSVSMSTLASDTAADYIVQFTTPTGVAAAGTIILTFPGGTDVNSATDDLDFTDVDLEDDGVDLVLAAGAAGATWGCGVTETAITFTSGTGTIVAGSVVTIEVGTDASGGNKQMVNQTTAENKADRTLDITGTFGDTGSINVYVNPAEGDVTVSATVDPTLSMALTGTTPNLGTLDTNGADLDAGAAGNQIPGTKITVSTNADDGVDITVKDLALGLNDGANNIDDVDVVPANWAAQAGEAFGIMATETGAKWDAGNNYVTDDEGKTYWDLTTTASDTTIYNGAGVESAKEIYAGFNAQIAATTVAGSYTDTVTFVATATF
jgi:hypothetical protein